MNIKKFTTIPLIIIIILSSLAMVGCGNSNTSTDIPINEGDFKLPQISSDHVLGNEAVKLDVSNSSSGYLCMKYEGESENVMLQLTCGDSTYTYAVHTVGQFLTFPFSCGDGTYNVQVYENLFDNQYALVYAETVDVTLEDETTPFLFPNYYVNYTADSPVVSLAYQVTTNSETQLDVVEDVYTYVIKNIDYDYDKASQVETGYVPDLDQVIDSKKGICFDYASLMTAMLRVRNIPAKLVTGYSGDAYHAWISVYISDVGWISDVIEFDGSDWTLMDPTYAASASGNGADYVNNQDQYHALYFY